MADILRLAALHIAQDLPVGDPTRRQLLAAVASDRIAIRPHPKFQPGGVKRLREREEKKEEKKKKPEGPGDPLCDKMKPWKDYDVYDRCTKSEKKLSPDAWRAREHGSRALGVRGPGREASQQKEASGADILGMLIDGRGFVNLYREMKKTDQQSADLLMQIRRGLVAALTLTENQEMAINRLRNSIDNKGRWDPALQRNNIFKAANLLGISLPSGMF